MLLKDVGDNCNDEEDAVEMTETMMIVLNNALIQASFSTT
jgi:peptidoglycan hydrolase-like amidase